jgi:hypothetical protein
MIIDGTRSGRRIVHGSVGRRGVFLRTGISRRTKQRCCCPGERCDDHRRGAWLAALVRDAAPDRAARAVHPLVAAPGRAGLRCLRRLLMDLRWTWHVPGDLARMLAGGQASGSLAHYGCRGPGPGTGFSGGGRLAWSEEPEALNWLGRRGNASASCRSGCAAYAGSAGLPRAAARAAHGRFAPRIAVTRCCGRALQMAALSLVPMMCRRRVGCSGRPRGTGSRRRQPRAERALTAVR